ncbi:MAG TPA: tetratricopeptide repeat protein [Polyangia bacterium]|nr:tetratricopeptide repeat protein [Polyangia bacterium]
MVVALCLLAVAGTARAENPARAKVAYKEGLLQYNLGEYEKALDKFKTAYLELPDPAFLFNIAQCQRQLGQYAAASKSYRAFLRETPNPPPRMREDVTRLIAEMDEAVRDSRAHAPPTGTQPPHDEGTNTTTTTTTTAPPPPDTTTTTTTAPPPPTTVVVAAPPPPPRPWYKNVAGISLTGGGVVVAVIGAGLLGKAGADDSSARNALTLPDQNNFHSSAQTFQSAGIALLVVGSAAAVTGAVLLAVGARHKRTEVR